MQDTKLFETILGLQPPWHIAQVALDTSGERVDLWVEHAADTRWTCPECGEPAPGHDHADERVWRHLDTCQYHTFLHARVPRIDCPTHGVRQVGVPWAAPRSRFTLLLERLIIDLITQCSTVTGACRIARVSWDEAWGVMDRAVTRGLQRRTAQPRRYVGVDEKAFRKGHRYHTIVCDLEEATVQYVAEDRTAASLQGYYTQLTPAQREALQAVAMDMWPAYIRATVDGLPHGDTKIVFDRFHIMREMTRAVDTVRKQEHRTLLREQGTSPLTGTKYLWLYEEDRLPAERTAAFAALQTQHLKVSRAWAIKELLRDLWTYHQGAAVRRFFARWYGWAIRRAWSPSSRSPGCCTGTWRACSATSSTPSPMGSPKASTARS